MCLILSCLYVLQWGEMLPQLHFCVDVTKPLLDSIWHSLKEKKDNLNMNLVQFIVFWWHLVVFWWHFGSVCLLQHFVLVLLHYTKITTWLLW